MAYPIERMDSNPPESPSEIEDPNIDDPKKLNDWLDRYVQKPFLGYADKRHDDGTPLSFDEQVEESKEQLRMMAREMPEIGASKEEVISNLKEWTEGLQEEVSQE